MSLDQVTVHLRGNSLVVRASGVTTRIPANKPETLVRLLQARRVAALKCQQGKAERMPLMLQADVDKWLKQGNKITRAEPKTTAAQQREADWQSFYEAMGVL